MKVEIIRNLKYDLEYIGFWKKMDEPDFKNKIYVALEITNQEIKKDFGLEGNLLELEYVCGKKFVSYSSVSSMYDIDEESLLEIARDNDFEILHFPKVHSFVKDYIFVLNKLIEKDIKIIPLNGKLLVDEKDLEVPVKKEYSLKSEPINV